jgi:hypothetical protein
VHLVSLRSRVTTSATFGLAEKRGFCADWKSAHISILAPVIWSSGNEDFFGRDVAGGHFLDRKGSVCIRGKQMELE